ncbi:MAG: 4-hydroxy-tetrahydrodipicolinate reductase [Chitinophagales bacterium]|nr:4-hydroxy-tetrahydrodipicolinate reductase [Chitinophagales bacterium]MDW8427982.1 4-hydroxy-tetrahydrodipicolinate reductase [Chitinophagales bacterium]
MKLVLFGYGRMGQLVAQEALSTGHEVRLIVRRINRDTITADQLRQADVALDFTSPDAVLSNVLLCFEAQLPVVVGTTGWYDALDHVRDACLRMNGSLLYGSNFSTGMNIVFRVNQYLARLMREQTSFAPSIEEIHHQHKKDAPSGTAITLAEDLIAASGLRTSWAPSDRATAHQLPISSIRESDHIGEHTVTYASEGEIIRLQHRALSRRIFAQGALSAAQWLHGRKGFYSFSDMFSLH